MADLVGVHGGLKEPVNRHGTGRASRFVQGASGHSHEGAGFGRRPLDGLSLWRRRAEPAGGSDGLGHLQPGARQGLHRSRGEEYAWTIPLSLPVTKELASKLETGQQVALTNSAGQIVATLDITDVFEWDKPKYIKSVYLTDRTDHPGARHGAEGGRRQDVSAGRHDPRVAAAEEPKFRQVRPQPARGA